MIRDRHRIMAERLIAVMRDLTGTDPLERSRRRDLVAARMMIAFVLAKDGASEPAIGELLGMNHTTIHYYITERMPRITLPGWEAEYDIWLKFKKAVWN